MMRQNEGMSTTPNDQIAESDRYQRGLALVREVNGDTGGGVLADLADIAPDLATHIVAYGYGEVYSRPGLVPQQRQLVTLGILTALGGCEAELEVHIGSSLNVGLTPTEIVEALIHSAAYCGFPRAINAVTVAKKVFAARGLLPVKPAE